MCNARLSFIPLLGIEEAQHQYNGNKKASYCCGTSVTVVCPGGRPRRALRAAIRCCIADCARTSATGSDCGVNAPISCCKRAWDTSERLWIRAVMSSIDAVPPSALLTE